MTNSFSEEQSRITDQECGAQLLGEPGGRLFDATRADQTFHHPEPLGAVGLDVVAQMAERRPGADSV